MFVNDLEYDLMNYCLNQKGKWWANHIFRNEEVNCLYDKLRRVDAGAVICIVQNGDANYQKHIDLYNKIKIVN
jgi:hypothetical protein